MNTARYPRRIVDDARVQKQFNFEHYIQNVQLILNVFNIANHQNITAVGTTAYTLSGSTLDIISVRVQHPLPTTHSESDKFQLERVLVNSPLGGNRRSYQLLNRRNKHSQRGGFGRRVFLSASLR